MADARPPLHPAASQPKWKSDAAGLLVLYALAVPLSPQFHIGSVPDVRPTDLILVFIVFALMSGVRSREFKATWKSPALLNPMIAMLVWGTLRMAVLPGYNLGGSATLVGIYYTLKRLEYGFVFMVAYTICVNPGACSRVIRALVMGSLGFNLLILYAFHQNGGSTGYRASAFGTDQPNQTAVFIVGIAGVAMVWMQTAAGKAYRLLGLLVLATGAAALLATGSKEGLLSAILAACILSIRRGSWSVVVATALIGVCAWPLFPSGIRDRYSYILVETNQTWQAVTVDPTLMPSAGSSSLANRIINAEYVFNHILPDCYLTGNGMGYKRLGFIDDTYLFEWVSNGLVGLSLLLWFMWVGWQEIRRADKSKDEMLRTVAGAMECYFLICAVAGFAMEVFFVVRPMELFYLLMGVMAGRARYLTLKPADRLAADAVGQKPDAKGRAPLPRPGQRKALPT